MARIVAGVIRLAVLVAVGVAGWRVWRALSGEQREEVADPGSSDALDDETAPVPTASTSLEVADHRAEANGGAEADRGAVAWRPPVDGGCPDGYPIKANERSGIFHVPGGLSYERTMPSRCYADTAAAEADGFRRARR